MKNSGRTDNGITDTDGKNRQAQTDRKNRQAQTDRKNRRTERTDRRTDKKTQTYRQTGTQSINLSQLVSRQAGSRPENEQLEVTELIDFLSLFSIYKERKKK